MTYTISQGRSIGIADLSMVANAGTAPLGIPGVGALPSVTFEEQLGEIVSAWDTAANAATIGAGGFGEFIFLRIPTSTAVTKYLAYSYDPSTYNVVIVPTSLGTQGVSGFPICWAINTVASDSTNVQYTWFQVGGRCTALKTAVQVAPGGIPIYTSGTTAGRIKVLGSAFRAIIGARCANATTVTSTTSTVAIYINGRPCITAGI